MLFFIEFNACFPSSNTHPSCKLREPMADVAFDNDDFGAVPIEERNNNFNGFRSI
jgi:hypothetical protein